MRHTVIKFDYVNNDGVRFIQYGNTPVRWMMYKRKDKKCPGFLASYGWKLSYKKFGFMFGTTKKPLKFEEKWGMADETLRNERSGEGRSPALGHDKQRLQWVK